MVVPIFTGNEAGANLEFWIKWMETYFAQDGDFTDDQKLAMAWGFIYDEAEAWLVDAETFETWEALKEGLVLRFRNEAKWVTREYLTETQMESSLFPQTVVAPQQRDDNIVLIKSAKISEKEETHQMFDEMPQRRVTNRQQKSVLVPNVKTDDVVAGKTGSNKEHETLGGATLHLYLEDEHKQEQVMSLTSIWNKQVWEPGGVLTRHDIEKWFEICDKEGIREAMFSMQLSHYKITQELDINKLICEILLLASAIKTEEMLFMSDTFEKHLEIDKIFGPVEYMVNKGTLLHIVAKVGKFHGFLIYNCNTGVEPVLNNCQVFGIMPNRSNKKRNTLMILSGTQWASTSFEENRKRMHISKCITKTKMKNGGLEREWLGRLKAVVRMVKRKEKKTRPEMGAWFIMGLKQEEVNTKTMLFKNTSFELIDKNVLGNVFALEFLQENLHIQLTSQYISIYTITTLFPIKDERSFYTSRKIPFTSILGGRRTMDTGSKILCSLLQCCEVVTKFGSNSQLILGAVNSSDFWLELLLMGKGTHSSKKWGFLTAVNATEQAVKVQMRLEIWNAMVSVYANINYGSYGLESTNLIPLSLSSPTKDASVQVHGLMFGALRMTAKGSNMLDLKESSMRQIKGHLEVHGHIMSHPLLIFNNDDVNIQAVNRARAESKKTVMWIRKTETTDQDEVNEHREFQTYKEKIFHEEAKDKLQQLQEVIWIFENDEKGPMYNQTGSADDVNLLSNLVDNLKDFFNAMYKITKKDIEEFETIYKGSETEKNDLLEHYKKYTDNIDRLIVVTSPNAYKKWAQKNSEMEPLLQPQMRQKALHAVDKDMSSTMFQQSYEKKEKFDLWFSTPVSQYDGTADYELMRLVSSVIDVNAYTGLSSKQIEVSEMIPALPNEKCRKNWRFKFKHIIKQKDFLLKLQEMPTVMDQSEFDKVLSAEDSKTDSVSNGSRVATTEHISTVVVFLTVFTIDEPYRSISSHGVLYDSFTLHLADDQQYLSAKMRQLQKWAESQKTVDLESVWKVAIRGIYQVFILIKDSETPEVETMTLIPRRFGGMLWLQYVKDSGSLAAECFFAFMWELKTPKIRMFQYKEQMEEYKDTNSSTGHRDLFSSICHHHLHSGAIVINMMKQLLHSKLGGSIHFGYLETIKLIHTIKKTCHGKGKCFIWCKILMKWESWMTTEKQNTNNIMKPSTPLEEFPCLVIQQFMIQQFMLEFEYGSLPRPPDDCFELCFWLQGIVFREQNLLHQFSSEFCLGTSKTLILELGDKSPLKGGSIDRPSGGISGRISKEKANELAKDTKWHMES